MIRFRDVATARVLKEIQCDQGAIFSMALSADQSYVATGSTDSSVAVWDAHTGKRVYTLKGHSSPSGFPLTVNDCWQLAERQ